MNVYDKLSDPLALSVFVFTLLLPIGIGLWAMKRTRDQEDFFVGGRSMGKLTVALSAISSGRSSWLVLGLSGMAYKLGMQAVWAIVGYITVEAFQFVYLGKRLRRETQTIGAITLLDYFGERFSDRHHTVRIVGSLIIGVFITAYVAAQFNAGAKTLSTALEWPLWVSLLVAGALILVYMVLGGYVAVAFNDVVRAMIMLIGLVVLPLIGLITIGGVSSLTTLLNQFDPSYLDPFSLGMGAMIGFVGIGLGSPGQPHIVVRYMSIDDPNNLTMSAIIGTFWNIVLGLGAISVGLIGRTVVPQMENLPDQDPEMIYLVLSSQYFGPVLYGLLVGGVFAAILSTADSQLLVVASTFVRDLYEKIWKKGVAIDEAHQLRLSRLVVIIAGLIAMVLAYVADDLVFWLVLFAWGGLGASLGPALILSLYWRRTSRMAVLFGMLTGTATTIIWKLFYKADTGVYELIPAFFGASAVIVVTSLFSRQK